MNSPSTVKHRDTPARCDSRWTNKTINRTFLTSSLMFGLAHVGQPFSIPVLILIGVTLGYARIHSGGLALPMLMHGAHNFVVLWIEGVA